MFTVDAEDNGTNLWFANYGFFVSNNATGTRPNGRGIEGDAYQVGAGTVTNLVGQSGYTEVDNGTVGTATGEVTEVVCEWRTVNNLIGGWFLSNDWWWNDHRSELRH